MRTPRSHCSLAPSQPQILRRESLRYDDQRGPVVLVAILLAVFILSYILAVVYIF